MKDKLRTHIGTAPDHQRLELRQYGTKLRELSDNNRKLGFYSVESGMEIHVIDTDPFSLSRGGGLTDISLIEKHRMADEDYDKRKGTIREFIREKRKVDPNYKLKPKSTPATAMAGAAAGGVDIESTAPGLESVEGITVGARCEVQPGARRGTVRFVGEIPELRKGGYWVRVFWCVFCQSVFYFLAVTGGRPV